MVVNFFHEAWAYVGVAAFIVLIRFTFKIAQQGWRKLAVDDLLMFLALLFYAAETSAAHVIVSWMGMANNNMTPEYRASLDPNSEEWKTRVKGSKMNIVGWFTYTTLFWLLKSCWTIYYSRMTDGLHKMDVRIKLAWAMLAATFVACVAVIIFQCRPFHRNWQINPNPGNACQPAYSFLQVSFIMALNTVTDLYLMAIPIPIIWKARLDIKTKVSLLILFSLSWIVIIFGIIRCVTLVTTGEYEISQSGPWSVRESFLAMVISNAPVVVPLLRNWFNSVTGFASSHLKSAKSGSYQLDSRNGANDSKAASHKYVNSIDGGGKRKKYQHPLSLPTKWGSDEDITMDQQVMGTGGRAVDAKDDASENSFERNKRRGSRQVQPGYGRALSKDIVVTQEWEVAHRQG